MAILILSYYLKGIIIKKSTTVRNTQMFYIYILILGRMNEWCSVIRLYWAENNIGITRKSAENLCLYQYWLY